MRRERFPTSLALALVLSVALAAGCRSTGARPEPESIRWRTLAEGSREAAETKRPCLVDFYFGANCHRCSQLDRHVYTNPYVIHRVNTEFIPVRIDLQKPLTEAEQALMEKMETGGECMLLFLHPDGTVLKDSTGVRVCTMGMISPEQFIRYLDRALESVRND